jgi:hypothetical protein
MYQESIMVVALKRWREPVGPIPPDQTLWWRFGEYELREGYIRPASGSAPYWYDPWEEHLKSRNQGQPSPWEELIKMLDGIEYVLDPRRSLFRPVPKFDDINLDAVLAWHSKYGPLGSMLHEAHTIFLWPRYQPAERSPTNEGNPRVLKPVQEIFHRSADKWSRTYVGVEDSTQWILEQPNRAGEVLAENSIPVGLVPAVAIGDIKEYSLEESWAPFFPDLSGSESETYRYPLPFTDDFCLSYAEPYARFLDTAVGVAESLLEIARAKGDASIGGFKPKDVWLTSVAEMIPVVIPKVKELPVLWKGYSLASNLVSMAIHDLATGWLLRECKKCGKLYSTDHARMVYCSKRCTQAAGAAAYRKRKKAGKKSTRSSKKKKKGAGK